mgnify:CR=1 FL=1|tara:strand:+ start:130 stop:714 length:585 start_codon:yes stop_codon:yes gene_type:complete
MYNPEINSNLKRLRLNTESMLMSPPEDSSKKTTIELDLLENIGRRLKDVDIDTIKEYNENLLSKYMNILNQFSLPVDICEITELLDDVKKIVMMEKRKNHRNRPVVVGSRQGYEIKETVESGSESSYPSGHSTESMFLSLYFSDKYPLYKDVFMEMANKVSNSRLLSSNSFPTDNLAGQTIAHFLFNNYKENKE